MTHPLRVAENCMTHPLHKAPNLVAHPPILFDQSLSTMLGFSGNESNSGISDHDAESSDEDDRSSTNDNKDSERIVMAGPMIMMPLSRLSNVRRRNQEVPSIAFDSHFHNLY